MPTWLATTPEILRDRLLELAGRPEFILSVPGKHDQEYAMEVLRQASAELSLLLFGAEKTEGAPPPFEVGEQKHLTELINRCFLSLAIPPALHDFIQTVLPPSAFESPEALSEAVTKFRVLSMYCFGSFRRGYKVFARRRDPDYPFVLRWRQLFYPESELRKEAFARRSGLPIEPVDGHNLWTLGYIAGASQAGVNAAREELRPTLEAALTEGVGGYQEFEEFVRKRSRSIEVWDVPQILAGAALGVDLVSKQVDRAEYILRLQEAVRECEVVSQERLESLQRIGRLNTHVYSTTEEVDVYVATSMRNLTDFSTQSSLVRKVFGGARLGPLKIRFFDPTQAFSHERVDKGLLEFMMLMRAQVVLYNAQEQDSFGKDSEVAFGLALRKHAVVYVARLFGSLDAFSKLYTFIDEHRGLRRGDLIDDIAEAFSWRSEQTDRLTLLGTEAEIVGALIGIEAKTLVDTLDQYELVSELADHGYGIEPVREKLRSAEAKPTGNDEARYLTELRSYTLNRIRSLERRASTFSEMHPLSLQTSPLDGVSRGIIVCRSLATTEEVLERLLLGTMSYYLSDVGSDSRCVLLRDGVTDSPVRVMTNDAVLSTAFWSTFSRLKGKFPHPTFADPD